MYIDCSHFVTVLQVVIHWIVCCCCCFLCHFLPRLGIPCGSRYIESQDFLGIPFDMRMQANGKCAFDLMWRWKCNWFRIHIAEWIVSVLKNRQPEKKESNRKISANRTFGAQIMLAFVFGRWSQHTWIRRQLRWKPSLFWWSIKVSFWVVCCALCAGPWFTWTLTYRRIDEESKCAE